jgi:hypothetical protein
LVWEESEVKLENSSLCKKGRREPLSRKSREFDPELPCGGFSSRVFVPK